MGEFEEAGHVMLGAVTAAMAKFAIEIMTESVMQCPTETGVLKDSAHILPVERHSPTVSVTFGYGFGDEINPKTNRIAAEYVVPVHEKLEAKHPFPTKAKFLEDPVLEHAPRFGPSLSASIKLALLSEGRVVPLSVGQMSGGQFFFQDTLDREAMRVLSG